MGNLLSSAEGVHYDKKTGIYTNTWPAPKILNISLYEYLFGNVSFDDATVAFVDHGEKVARRSITRGQLKLEVHRLGQGLVQAGFRQGDVVMILAGNSIDWVITVLACQFAGLTTALASPVYGAKEVQHVVDLTQPVHLFTPSPLLSKAAEAKVPQDKVLAMDDGGAVKSMWSLCVSEQEARKAEARVPPTTGPNGQLNTTAVLAFSSGTTGLPKAVMESHRNLVSMLTLIRCFPSNQSTAKRVLNCLPFFHAMAFVLHVLLPIGLGSTVHIQVPFDPKLFLQLIVKEKIQSTVLVPPIMLAFSRLPMVNRETFASMQSMGSGGAPLDVETQKRIIEKTGADVAQGWGMTETTVGCLGIHYNMTPGTVGRVLPGVEARLMDVESGKPVQPGERGELQVRGPNIFVGYYRNPQATADTMTPEGFLRTGDVAVVNEKGEFSIVDRIKELIKYKGNQIAPAELEALLNGHPSIALSGVIGVYSKEQATELPRAYVQLSDGVERKEGLEKELQDWVKERAAAGRRTGRQAGQTAVPGRLG